MSMRGALVFAGLAAPLLPVSAGVAAQEVRSNARVYYDAETSLRRAEVEARDCGDYVGPALLRAADLRDRLHGVRGFARTGGELDRLWRDDTAARAAGDEELCVSRRGIEPNLQHAQQDITLLEQRVGGANRLASGQ